MNINIGNRRKWVGYEAKADETKSVSIENDEETDALTKWWAKF